jgi:hypothetical protein
MDTPTVLQQHPAAPPVEVTRVASPVQKTTPVGIEVDIGGVLDNFDWSTPERTAKAMKAAVKAFNDFIRDHRSMDHYRLDVRYETKTTCDQCNNVWEVARDESGPYCAYCGVVVKEQ